MLNGPTYSNLVKHFFVRAEVYDRWTAEEELREKRARFPKNAQKTREELGLKEFKEIEIRSPVLGVNVVISRRSIEQLIRSKDKRMFLRDANEN